MDQTGKTFGQYRIVRLLGRGGMGEVHEAEHRVLQRRYALKLLPADFASRPEAVRRFEREAAVMANLEHPHIVRVDEYGETDGRYWLRMELVHGVAASRQSAGSCISLADFAADRGGRIAEQEFLPILQQLLEGLAYAHCKGVVHRDLKPSNVLLESAANGQMHVKISDFGLARVVGEDFIRSQAQQSVGRSMGNLPTQGLEKSIGGERTMREDEGTSTRALLGTYEYMAPEQKRGEEADARSDVYAMGLMCYRLLTGKELGLKMPSRLMPGLCADWDGFVEKALEEVAIDRYADGRSMLDALEPVLTRSQRQDEEVRLEAEIHKAEEASREEAVRLAEWWQRQEAARKVEVIPVQPPNLALIAEAALKREEELQAERRRLAEADGILTQADINAEEEHRQSEQLSHEIKVESDFIAGVSQGRNEPRASQSPRVGQRFWIILISAVLGGLAGSLVLSPYVFQKIAYWNNSRFSCWLLFLAQSPCCSSSRFVVRRTFRAAQSFRSLC